MKRKLLLLVLVFIIIVCMFNSRNEYFTDEAISRNVLGDMYPGPNGKLILFPGDDGVDGYDYSKYDEKKSISEMLRQLALYAPYFFDYYLKLDIFKNLTVDLWSPTIEEKILNKQVVEMEYIFHHDAQKNVVDNMFDFSYFNPYNLDRKRFFVSNYYFINIIRHHIILSNIYRPPSVRSIGPVADTILDNIKYVMAAFDYIAKNMDDLPEFNNITYLDKSPIPNKIIMAYKRSVKDYIHGMDYHYYNNRLTEVENFLKHAGLVFKRSLITLKNYKNFEKLKNINQTFVGPGHIPAMYIFDNKSRLERPDSSKTIKNSTGNVTCNFTYNENTIDDYKKMYDIGLTYTDIVYDYEGIYNPMTFETHTELQLMAKENRTSVIFYPYTKNGKINTYNYSGTSLSVYNRGYSWTNIKTESIINNDIENTILACDATILKINYTQILTRDIISIFDKEIQLYKIDDCIPNLIRKFINSPDRIIPDFGEIVYNNHIDIYTSKSVDTSSNPLYLDVYFYNYIAYNGASIPYFYVDYRKNLRLFIIYISSPDFVGYMTILDAAKKLLLTYMNIPPDWPYSEHPPKKDDPNAYYKFDNGNFAAFKTVGDRKLNFWPYF